MVLTSPSPPSAQRPAPSAQRPAPSAQRTPLPRPGFTRLSFTRGPRRRAKPPWLRQRLSPAWAIGISGTLFGLMHQLPAFIPLATIVGSSRPVGFGRRPPRRFMPIAMPVVQNVVFVAVSLLVTGWDATLPMG